jgi:hypothetical protein
MPPIRRWQEKSTADPQDDVGYGASINWKPGKNGSFWTFGYAQDNSKDAFRPYTEAYATYTSATKQDFSFIAELWKIQEISELHYISRLTLNQIINEDWTMTTYLERERYNRAIGEGWNDYIIEPELAYQSIANLIYRYETTAKDVGEERSAWRLWEIKLHPDENQEIDILYGSRRAGFVCSGGICRQEPEFEGFRADYILRF